MSFTHTPTNKKKSQTKHIKVDYQELRSTYKNIPINPHSNTSINSNSDCLEVLTYTKYHSK